MDQVGQCDHLQMEMIHWEPLPTMDRIPLTQSNLEGESLGDEPPPLNGGSGSSQSNLEGDSLGGEPSSNIQRNPPPIPDPPLNGSGLSQSNLEIIFKYWPTIL